MSVEQWTLDSIGRQFRSQGYDVVVDPSSSVLPEFLASSRPDMLAFGEKDNVVIEFTRGEPGDEGKLKEIARLVEGQPKWRLYIVRYDPGLSPSLPTVGKRDIAEVLAAAERELSQPTAALLLAWAAFEAAARRVDPLEFRKPQSPGRVVNGLMARGLLSVQDQTLLEKMTRLRNSFIHGDLRTSPEPEDVRQFIAIVRSVVEMPEAA